MEHTSGVGVVLFPQYVPDNEIEYLIKGVRRAGSTISQAGVL